MTVLVGPKVYMLPVRRLASLCFGSIKIPQSQSRASGEAVMPRREVAQLAMQTLESVAQRYAAGDHVLIFNEGTRSRTGAMQRMLAASARYFEVEGAVIVPLGLWGTEKLVPLDSEKVRPAQVLRARRPAGGRGGAVRARGRTAARLRRRARLPDRRPASARVPRRVRRGAGCARGRARSCLGHGAALTRR